VDYEGHRWEVRVVLKDEVGSLEAACEWGHEDDVKLIVFDCLGSLLTLFDALCTEWCIDQLWVSLEVHPVPQGGGYAFRGRLSK
jgi:hypothetical protein